MTIRQRKIIHYLSYEILLFAISFSNLSLTFVQLEPLSSVLKIVGSILIIGSLLVVLFFSTNFYICAPANILKIRNIIYSAAWAFSGVAIFSVRNFIPFDKFWAILAVLCCLLHYVLELVLYLKGNLKIE